MKILHVTPSLNPVLGGTVEGLKQLVSATLNLGHVVEVAVLDAPGAKWLERLPFTVHALGPSFLKYRYSPGFIPWLRNHADEYDAIIVEGLWQYHGYATRKVLKKRSIPYFVFTHGMLSPWFKKAYPLKHLKKWLYWPWAEYRVLRDAKAVLFTCEEEKILSRQSFWLYNCNEVVVGYGTTIPRGNFELQRDMFFERFPNLRGKKLLLFLSRIHEKKGCDLLIEAFSRVAGRDPDLHLVMAGPDQAGWQPTLVERSVKLEIGERITWTGMISGDLKWGAYSAAEAFVLPSHDENFGVVVAEALACGKPVLISNKVNIWREIESAGAGIVGEDTVDGTVGILSQWLSLGAEQQQMMHRNARTCFETRFDIGQVAKNFVAVVSAN